MCAFPHQLFHSLHSLLAAARGTAVQSLQSGATLIPPYCVGTSLRTGFSLCSQGCSRNDGFPASARVLRLPTIWKLEVSAITSNSQWALEQLCLSYQHILVI